MASFNFSTPDESFTTICNINNMYIYSYILLSCFINIGVKVAFTTSLKFFWTVTANSLLQKDVSGHKCTSIKSNNSFVGFVTNGEFNSLCTMGSKWPISLLQLISDSRKMARSMHVTQIERYFTLDAHGKPMHFKVAIHSFHVRTCWCD